MPDVGWFLGGALSLAGSVWDWVMKQIWSAGLDLLRGAFRLAGEFSAFSISTGDGPVGALWPMMLWLSAAIAVCLFLVQLTSSVLRGGRGISRVMLGPVQYCVALAVSVGAVATLLAATDGLTTGILIAGLRVESFEDAFTATGFGDGVSDGAKATVLGLIALFGVIPAAVAYAVEMVFRAAAIHVLVITIPIAAAGLLANVTAKWFWRVVRWLLAALMMQPVLALTLVIGAALGGHNDDVFGLLVGAAVFEIAVVAPFALFRLFAFVDPNTDAGAGLRDYWEGQGIGSYGPNNPVSFMPDSAPTSQADGPDATPDDDDDHDDGDEDGTWADDHADRFPAPSGTGTHADTGDDDHHWASGDDSDGDETAQTSTGSWGGHHDGGGSDADTRSGGAASGRGGSGSSGSDDRFAGGAGAAAGSTGREDAHTPGGNRENNNSGGADGGDASGSSAGSVQGTGGAADVGDTAPDSGGDGPGAGRTDDADPDGRAAEGGDHDAEMTADGGGESADPVAGPDVSPSADPGVGPVGEEEREIDAGSDGPSIGDSGGVDDAASVDPVGPDAGAGDSGDGPDHDGEHGSSAASDESGEVPDGSDGLDVEPGQPWRKPDPVLSHPADEVSPGGSDSGSPTRRGRRWRWGRGGGG